VTAPPTKLRLALEDAKEKLRDSIHTHSSSESTPVPQASPKPKRKAQSKLNTLLCKSEVEDGRLSLFQRVGVSQRPTYDLIADRILGPSVGEPASFLDHDSTYADHVAERLKKLRRSGLGDNDSHDPSDGEDGMVGVEGDGRPVWSHILDEHRGRSSVVLESELLPVDQNHPLHARNVLEIRGDWQKPMHW